MLGYRRLVTAEAGDQPVACRVGIGQRLERRERLRGHDEQGLGRVEVAGRLGDVGAVDIRHEPEGHVALGVVAQRLVGHHGTQVGSADADVDDVADPLTGVPRPFAAAHTPGEVRHPIEHVVHLGDHVLAVDDQACIARQPQRGVQHRPILCHVDPIPAEHRLDPLAQAHVLGQRDQQADGLIGEAMLGVVQIQAGALRRQLRPALRVLGEQVAKVQSGDLGVVRLERPVSVAVGQRRRRACHVLSPLSAA